MQQTARDDKIVQLIAHTLCENEPSIQCNYSIERP